MKKNKFSTHTILAIGIMAVAISYSMYHFNYFETPTADFIGNIRPPVIEYGAGNFPGDNFKFLPAYPLVLALLTRINPFQWPDPIYHTALLLNMFLFIPYIILVFLVYRRFLSEKVTSSALLFLSVNIYSVYTAANSELEMMLTLLVILSLYLTMKDSKLAYLTAFFTATTKWDSVFIIPSVMFRDFFYKKKRILAIMLGALAAGGVAAWLILSIIHTMGYANPYVGEIVHRGPNLYRYIIDCFLIASGFIQWMATHGYFSDDPVIKAALLVFLIVPTIVVASGITWGIVLVWRKKRSDFAPILLFFFGFLLIHLIYQNTKERYVLPILWLLNLFLFIGITDGMYPLLKKAADRLSKKKENMLLVIFLPLNSALYIVSMGMIFLELTPFHITFAIIFTFLVAMVLTADERWKSVPKITLLILICGIIINAMIFYGGRTMDHYSLRRVEFKKAALWFKEHAGDSDIMLISETNFPIYYTGFQEKRFVSPFAIRSIKMESLIGELTEKKVTYVFVDDFYIRRLKYKDKNAIDRKAGLFKEIRDKALETGHFQLAETFETRGGIKSYLYRFLP